MGTGTSARTTVSSTPRPTRATGGLSVTPVAARAVSRRTPRPQTESPRDVLARFLRRPMTSFYLILAVSGALLVLGLVMMLSASSVESLVDHGSSYWLFQRQAMWVGVGLVALWLGIRFRPIFYRRIAHMAMLLSVILLTAVLVPGIGTLHFGARRWIDLGPMYLQPSELAKLAFVLWGADVLVRKQKMLGRWRHLLVPVLPGLVVLGALVMLEPDLGTTACFFLVFLALLWTIGTPLRLFALMFVGVFAVGGLAIALEPYRLQRLVSFFNPAADPLHTGYQAVQGLYALGGGGWFGVGLGNSRLKWPGALPNQHSDYIFAIIGEELGFVGCVLVLALFAAFAYAGFRIARRTADPFVRLASSAIVVWLIGQALINIGYVVGLLPVTGVPLPFISSGGTSLVLTMFVVGILASFARHEPGAVKHLQRSKNRFGRLLGFPMPYAAVTTVARRAPAPPRRTPPPARRTPAPATNRRPPPAPARRRQPAAPRRPVRRGTR